MRIDDNLNLVLPLRSHEAVRKDAEGKEIREEVVDLYAFHTPISREVFEIHYRILAATKAALLGKGLQFAYLSGAQIATLRLKDEGLQEAAERGSLDRNGKVFDDKTPAFLGEIRRLTLILVPTDHGYEALPVDVCLQRNLIEDEEWQEVESAIVFFTALSSMTPRKHRTQVMESLAATLSGILSSSTPLEYAGFLNGSTAVSGSGQKRVLAASSGPI